jgi:hypothetical protein
LKHSKPMVLLHELVPGVVDAELAELGYWWRRHVQDGKHDAAAGGDEETPALNPHFEVDDGTRIVNLDDVMPLMLHGSEPKDPGAMEDYTRKRFEKYSSNVGAAEIITTFTGFAIGVGAIMAMQYVQNEIIGGSGTGNVSVAPIIQTTTDLVVSLL